MEALFPCRRLPGRALRQAARRSAARGRRRAQLRRLRRHLLPPRRDPARRAPRVAHAEGPPYAAPADAGRPPGQGGRRRDPRPRRPPGRDARRQHAEHRRPAEPRPDAPSPRRQRDGSAEAGLRLRPPLLVLRDPGLPRLVPLPPPDRHPGRGPLARRPGRPRAAAGQRELHLLRQGPRRHQTAGDAAAGDRGDRRRRLAARQLPPAGRDAPEPHRRDGADPRRRSLLRPLLPALLARRAAPHAPLRRHTAVPRSGRSCPTPVSAPTSS